MVRMHTEECAQSPDRYTHHGRRCDRPHTCCRHTGRPEFANAQRTLLVAACSENGGAAWLVTEGGRAE